MNLYLISQTENIGYDTYDSAVVCAESEEEAKNIYPSIIPDNEIEKETGIRICDYDKEANQERWESYDEWASNPNNVMCKFLGKADKKTKKGVICASFNAG